jgi:copper chaperone NosL
MNMTSAIAGAALGMAMLVASCTTQPVEPPVVQLDRSACSQCKMLISDLSWSAALRTPEGEEKLFDDLGCLAQYAKQHDVSHDLVWAHDLPTEQWIEAAHAQFVLAPSIHGPMGGHAVAFADVAAARRFAGTKGGKVVSFNALIQEGSHQ